MGREIRKVPKGWEHPKNDDGNYKPMYDELYIDALNEWLTNHNLWLKGKHPDQPREYKYYAEWDGDAPWVDYYRPSFDLPADHFQIYETVSEGTPTSPVFASKDEMSIWLVGEGYSEEAAKGFCEMEWAPSMAISEGVIKMGIHSAEDLKK